jgi:hypothetical protein
MDDPQIQTAATFSPMYPYPPRIHWAVLALAVITAEQLVLWLVPHRYWGYTVNVVGAIWPLYLCIWIRRLDDRSSSLYWAIASLVSSFLFSFLLWIVVIFEIREELLDHYNRREPVGLRLNWVLTLLFSFFYFQYELNKISREKKAYSENLTPESQPSVSA